MLFRSSAAPFTIRSACTSRSACLPRCAAPICRLPRRRPPLPWRCRSSRSCRRSNWPAPNDVVHGDADGLGPLDRRLQAHVHRRISAALLGRDDDGAHKFLKEIAPLRILSGLAMFDVSPFRVSRQKNHLINMLDCQAKCNRQMLDCQAKCNRQIEKGLIRGTKAERLSGTVVQAFYNP